MSINTSWFLTVIYCAWQCNFSRLAVLRRHYWWDDSQIATPLIVLCLQRWTGRSHSDGWCVSCMGDASLFISRTFRSSCVCSELSFANSVSHLSSLSSVLPSQYILFSLFLLSLLPRSVIFFHFSDACRYMDKECHRECRWSTSLPLRSNRTDGAGSDVCSTEANQVSSRRLSRGGLQVSWFFLFVHCDGREREKQLDVCSIHFDC